MPIFTSFLVRFVATIAFLLPVAALAQPELRYPIPGGVFTVDRFSQAKHVLVPDGLQIQALDRKDLFVSAHLLLPPSRNFEITRIVVRFRDPKNSSARLSSIRLTNEYGSKLLDEASLASGDRSSREVYAPVSSPNGWKIPVSKPPVTVSAKSVVRLEIGSGMGIEGGIGEPFVLIQVDVFVKNPAFAIPLPASTTTTATTGTRIVPTPAPPVPSTPAPVQITNLPGSKAIIYVVNDTKQLLWYRHDGRERGSFVWAAPTGSQVGAGWDFRTVIGAGNGVMYGVTPEGDLMWYRHTGAGNGSFQWAQPQGQKVNSGFAGTQVIAAGGGVLYGLKRNGDLYWYRHDGFADGTDRWTGREGRLIASKWPMSQIFAGDNGTLYAIRHGDLFRYRHDGRADGSAVWADPVGQKIATNWDYPFAFSSGDGIIYALNTGLQLLWFRDLGYADDTVRWANGGTGEIVGTGWKFSNIFSGAALKP